MTELTAALVAALAGARATAVRLRDAATAAEGTVVQLEHAAELAAATPGPIPTPVLVPADANLVRIGTATYPLAAVNPTPASNPLGFQTQTWAGRGPDQLVLCQAPWSRSGMNQYGVEVSVIEGEVRGAASVVAGGVMIPDSGYVLSGHGRADAWLRAHAKPGAVVEVVVADPSAPGPTPPPAGGRTLAVYLMDGVGTISQVPANITQVRVAFLQGTKLTEWGGDTPEETAADLTAWRLAQRQRHEVLIAIGGQGGAVAESSVPGAIRAIETKAPTIPVSGIDWDKEGGSLDVTAAVRTSVDLASGREASWLTAFTPPGGPPVATYMQAARACKAEGLRVQFSQQLYDTRIGLSDVLRQTELAATALGPENVLIGCMVGNDPAKYSTVAQWESYVAAMVKEFPTLGGAMLWESSRDGTAEWARRVGAVLGL